MQERNRHWLVFTDHDVCLKVFSFVNQLVRFKVFFEQLIIQGFLYDMVVTLTVPWERKYVPHSEKTLNLESGDCSTSHPIFDSGHVEDDLSFNNFSFSRTPITHMLNEPAKNVLPIGSYDDPPESL